MALISTEGLSVLKKAPTVSNQRRQRHQHFHGDFADSGDEQFYWHFAGSTVHIRLKNRD